MEKEKPIVELEFKTPIWLAKKVRKYLNQQEDVVSTRPKIESIEVEEFNFMIIIIFKVVIKGKRKFIRQLASQIKKDIELLEYE